MSTVGRWREERGANMVVVALAFTLLLLFTGLALDFGRAHLLRAQLQTAVDAGALAGALQALPMVALEVDRWMAVEDWCADPVSGEPYPCPGWEVVTPATATGPWRELIGRGRWRLATATQCSWPHRCGRDYRIRSEWVILPPATEQVAREALLLNATWPRGAHDAVIESVDIAVNRQRASVEAAATLRVPTHFLRLIGINELRLTRSGRARPIRRCERRGTHETPGVDMDRPADPLPDPCDSSVVRFINPRGGGDRSGVPRPLPAGFTLELTAAIDPGRGIEEPDEQNNSLWVQVPILADTVDDEDAGHWGSRLID